MGENVPGYLRETALNTPASCAMNKGAAGGERGSLARSRSSRVGIAPGGDRIGHADRRPIIGPDRRRRYRSNGLPRRPISRPRLHCRRSGRYCTRVVISARSVLLGFSRERYGEHSSYDKRYDCNSVSRHCRFIHPETPIACLGNCTTCWINAWRVEFPGERSSLSRHGLPSGQRPLRSLKIQLSPIGKPVTTSQLVRIDVLI
jgi:hypothetical protein